MGRKSKLTAQNETDIKNRLLSGERPADLAREFKISRSTFSEKFSETVKKMKAAISQLIITQETFARLPITEQLSVISFTDRLRNITNNLTGAAENGSLTAYLLSGVASAQAAKVNSEDPMESQEILQAISALTKISNDASVTGMNLLNMNKDIMVAQNTPTPKPRAIRIIKAEEMQIDNG